MTAGIVLLVAALVLRVATPNRHVRGRLATSAVCFLAFLLIAAADASNRISSIVESELRIAQPLLLAFGVVNAVIALLINPWRQDRVPERFPRIVQDAIVIGLFSIVAVLLLQDRIFAATAAGAVVVGLALQDTLGNLFAGLAIQVEKPFRVGHWVQIAGDDGQVAEVTWRATKLRTKTGNFIVVPNSKVADDIIVNYSEPTLDSRVDVEVGVTYDAPPNRVKQVLLDAVRDEPLLSASRPPDVVVVDFASSSITYRVRVWCDDFAVHERLRDRLRTAIWYALRRHRLEIPYPTQVEYSRQEAPLPTALDAESTAALDRVSIFASLSAEERQALAQAAVAGPYAAGTAIVRQGDAGASMFVIVRGEVVVRVDPGGREVARIGEGGYFGEMSLLTGSPRTATVTTTRDSEIIEITADAFRRFVLANPMAVEEVGHTVAARQAELAQQRATADRPASPEAPKNLIVRIRRFLSLDQPPGRGHHVDL